MMSRILITTLIMFSASLGYAQKGNKQWLTYNTDSKNILEICFTRNGKAIGIADLNKIKVFVTDSGDLLGDFTSGHHRQILSVDISADSTILASGGKDSIIVIWDLVTRKILKSLSFQKSIVTALKISPDSRFVLSGGADGRVYMYDLEADRLVNKFSLHRGDITSVAFSADGTIFGTAGADKMINIFNTENRDLLGSLSGHRSWVRDIRFSNDNSSLISCGDDSRVITWDISNLSAVRKQTETKYGSSWILCTDLNRDNKTLAVGGFNGNVLIVGLFGRYRINVGKAVTRVLFKPDEPVYLKVAIATMGNGVMLVDASKVRIASERSK